jgi:cobalamin biosynthesis protein CobT
MVVDDPRFQINTPSEADQTNGADNVEQQDFESELPVEYTTQKRTMEETGLDDIKRQKRLGEENDDGDQIYDQNSTAAYTEEQLQQYYQEYYSQQAAAAAEQAKAAEQDGGLIPQNILHSLKQLSGNKPLPTKSTPAPAVTTGLGGLADYGSDSDSD